MSTSLKKNPYLAFSFSVEIEGLVVGGFTEVTGIGATINTTEEIWEGGVNDFTHQFAKYTSYPKLVLKQGLSTTGALWTWFQQTVQGRIQQKNMTLYLLGETGDHLRSWHFFKAWPVEWQGPPFDASRSPVAIESFTLIHQGMDFNG